MLASHSSTTIVVALLFMTIIVVGTSMPISDRDVGADNADRLALNQLLRKYSRIRMGRVLFAEKRRLDNAMNDYIDNDGDDIDDDEIPTAIGFDSSSHRSYMCVFQVYKTSEHRRSRSATVAIRLTTLEHTNTHCVYVKTTVIIDYLKNISIYEFGVIIVECIMEQINETDCDRAYETIVFKIKRLT